MCKVKMLNSEDIPAIKAVYDHFSQGRAAIERSEHRFEEILDEYSGHAYGLFDSLGNMIAYALMDEEDKKAKEVVGEGCGYLLYVCCMDENTGFGLTFPSKDDCIPIGCAKCLTPEAEGFLSGPMMPYINILLN